MAEIWRLSHDAGTWAEYDTAPDPVTSGDLVFLLTGAGMDGTTYAIECDPNGDSNTTGKKDFATFDDTTTDIRFGFYLNRNDIAIDSGESCQIFELGQSGGQKVIIRLKDTGSGDFIEVEDANGETVASSVLGSGDYHIEVYLVREANATSADGSMTIYVDGSQDGTNTSLENYETWTDGDGLADEDSDLELAVGGSGLTGSFYIDEITLRDDSTPIFGSDSYLWHYNASTWADIGDSGWSENVTGVIGKGGTGLATLFACTGDDIELTTDTGTTWATRDTMSFVPAGIAATFGELGIEIVAVNSESFAVMVEKVVNAETGTVSLTDLTSTGHTTNGDGTDIKGVA